MGRPDDATYYGRVAFEKYRESQNWMTRDGEHMPEWDDTPLDLQECWVAAGDAVVKAFIGED